MAEVPHFQSQERVAARQLQLELAAMGTVHWVSPPNALWIDGGGGGVGRESAVVPTFLAQQNNCCSPFSTNPATVPKSSASSGSCP